MRQGDVVVGGHYQTRIADRWEEVVVLRAEKEGTKTRFVVARPDGRALPKARTAAALQPLGVTPLAVPEESPGPEVGDTIVMEPAPVEHVPMAVEPPVETEGQPLALYPTWNSPELTREQRDAIRAAKWWLRTYGLTEEEAWAFASLPDPDAVDQAIYKWRRRVALSKGPGALLPPETSPIVRNVVLEVLAGRWPSVLDPPVGENPSRSLESSDWEPLYWEWRGKRTHVGTAKRRADGRYDVRLSAQIPYYGTTRTDSSGDFLIVDDPFTGQSVSVPFGFEKHPEEIRARIRWERAMAAMNDPSHEVSAKAYEDLLAKAGERRFQDNPSRLDGGPYVLYDFPLHHPSVPPEMTVHSSWSTSEAAEAENERLIRRGEPGWLIAHVSRIPEIRRKRMEWYHNSPSFPGDVARENPSGPSTPARRLLDSASLAMGDKVALDDRGSYVKYHSRGTYVLHDAANRERMRWGTRDEIIADVDYFLINGHLPPASGPRW